MKIKDSYRIARIYMRSNKQKNNLIVNFSTTLIIFIIIAFLFISMYIGFIKKCDSIPYSNYGSIYYQGTLDTSKDLAIFNNTYGDDPRITNSLLFYEFETNTISKPFNPLNNGAGHEKYSTSLPNILIDDVLYKGDELEPPSNYSKLIHTLGIRVSSKENKSIYLEDDLIDFHKNNQGEIILAGSKKAPDKGEVFISKFFCDVVGISYEDIIGKSFSLYHNTKNNGTLFMAKNFVISGVINSDYKSILGVNSTSPCFMISELSLAPNELSTQENHIDGLLYLPYPMTLNNAGVKQVIVTKNIVDAYSLYKDITSFASRFNAPEEGFLYLYHTNNPCLSLFYEIYPILSSLITFGSIVGIALLFVCVLKLLSSVLYYINQNKEYFGMLKSLGMSTGDIIKLSLFQIIHIFLISSMISIVVSFIFCIIFTNAYNSKILKDSLYPTKNFEEVWKIMKINFADYFTSCSIIISISFILISLFTIVLSYKTSKKNAITLLQNYNN